MTTLGLRDYYNRDGTAFNGSYAEWCNVFGKTDRNVEKTKVGNDRWIVSTVFLGFDHSFGKGKPLIFETLVMGPEPYDGICYRYSNETEAVEGHEAVVQLLRQKIALSELVTWLQIKSPI